VGKAKPKRRVHCHVCDFPKRLSSLDLSPEDIAAAIYMAGFIDGMAAVIRSHRSRLCARHERQLVLGARAQANIELVEVSLTTADRIQ